MNTVLRKKSPRAPSIGLGEAIEKSCKIYEIERCHAAPVDGVAQHIGYKNAANGAAIGMLASLKYYGLLERPKEGMVAVSKDIEAYLFAPNETIKQALVTKWLKSPLVFAELLDKYTNNLPSEATLKYELIQRGFSPAAADGCLQVFLRSVDFAHYFERSQEAMTEQNTNGSAENWNEDEGEVFSVVPTSKTAQVSTPALQTITASDDFDRIPVRLAGGRRAWIEIPMPFYSADKERLKKQIDLLLTDDEEGADDLL